MSVLSLQEFTFLANTISGFTGFNQEDIPVEVYNAYQDYLKSDKEVYNNKLKELLIPAYHSLKMFMEGEV